MRTSFEVGTALNPYLAQLFVKTLVDTLEPKGSRKQRHEQEALAKLAEYEPRVSKMTESGKKDFYNRFFRAYGMSEAPFIRGLFGAGPEPILPLPEGSTEKGQFVKGPLGIGGRMQKQYIIPKPGPFKFEREEPAPLLPPAHERELRSWGFSTEDIKDILKKEPSQQQMIVKGQKLYSQAIKGGASREEALDSLGDLRTTYEDYLDDRALKKQQIESGIRVKEEGPRIAREREARLAQQFKETMALAERKQGVVEQQAQRMLTLKTTDAQTRNYIQIMKEKTQAQLRGITEHNRRQMDFYKLDPSFIPDLRDDSHILASWDDLYARVMSMQGAPGAPGVTPEVTPPLSNEDAAEKRLREKYKIKGRR